MSSFEAVPRRCVNLPPGSLKTLIACLLKKKVVAGESVQQFHEAFSQWLSAAHVLTTSSGRTAFQLALQALDLEPNAEIVFPRFTFPVMPMVARLLGYRPVFCDVDAESFNAGPEHFQEAITERTGAILATHLFGRPCAIEEIVELARARQVKVIEDCAHACGVRVAGRQVGTFGDVGVFSFAEGKNMPCFGGGAIATGDDGIFTRAQEVLAAVPMPDAGDTAKKALSIWVKWLLTRPTVFGIAVYPLLRLKDLLGKPLMDSTVGDELLESFARSDPKVEPLTNLQASIGLLQLQHIDAFNQGARRNARILTDVIGSLPGITIPQPDGGEHIYVYYPLTLDPEKRDSLRSFLLGRRIDTKVTDMSDCSRLKPFRGSCGPASSEESMEASILEICVYPVVSKKWMYRIADEIRSWSGK